MPLRLLVFLMTAGLCVAASAQDGPRLPDLGSSAGTVRSPAEDRQIGASMLHQMRALDMVLDDPLTSQYLNHLGYELVAHAHIDKGQQFTFFVVNSDEINAFAAPGGYIAVNAGLFRATRSEDELAAVLAHEISHVTQHHLLRSTEAARKATPLMLLGMLGALAASSQGGSSGANAGAAVMMGTLGALQQHMITFTRQDEAEADHVGIALLAEAGFDPDAMAGFFGRMEQLLRPGSGGRQAPELLQTHPVTSHRISDAKARAHALEQRMASQPQGTPGAGADWATTMAPLPYLKPGSDVLAQAAHAAAPHAKDPYSLYLLMRERVRVLTGTNRDVVRYYAANLEHDPGFDTPSNRYGYALALTRATRGAEAKKMLAPLLAKRPNMLALQLAMADAELIAGDRAASLRRYAAQLEGQPESHAVAEAYANALLASGTPADAKKAADILKPLLDNEVDEPTLYRVYGHACAVSGQRVRASRAYADAAFLSGRATDALNQLQDLLKEPDLDYYQRARIQADIDVIKPIALELRRRGIDAEKQGAP
ncbi:MAG TPA: M48 family metalloprotease [Rhodanobacteraceae bacterium]|nr:M48 family metalloprotease [Rhodanobacteraceae bacterium]